MKLSRRSKQALNALMLITTLAIIGCSDDPAPEEPVTVTEPEVPAAPPEDTITEPVAPTFDPETIYFAFDDYTLNAEAQNALNQLSDYLKAQSSTVVQIEGHCDERGSIEYNLALGERRAQSVKSYLVQLGVDPARLPTISYGEEKPMTDGTNESAWSQNRRAEFVISNP